MAAAPKRWRHLLWVLPLVLVPAALIAGVTLGRPPMIVATFAAAAAVIFMMTYAHYLQYRVMRRLDEVQKAGASFAQQWGPPAGQAVFALLLVLPPFKDAATAAVGAFVRSPAAHPVTVDGTVVLLSLTLGFVVLVLLESIGRVVVHTIWWSAKR